MRLSLAGPALLVAVLLSGCASTRLVDAANPADLARVQAREQGRTVGLTLTSGDLYRGTLVFLRPDSTAWEEETGVFAVPTADVSVLVVDTRRRALTRGALTGAGIGFGLCFGLGTAVGDDLGGSGSDNLTVGLVFGLACTPSGAFYGLLGGAVTARRTEYVFVDPAAETRTEPDPDLPGDPPPEESPTDAPADGDGE